MGIPEVCTVWMDQRAKEELAERERTAESLRGIGRKIAKEVEKYFEVKVKPETIYQRVRRSKSGTNVPSNTSIQNHTENSEIKEIKPKKSAKDGTMRGGKREGAGRPKKIVGVSDAMGFATIAISQMERIMDDDPEQIQAYLSVIDWVFGKMRKRVKGMKQEIAWGVVDKSLQSLVGKYMMNGLKISPKPSPKVMRGIENSIDDLQLFLMN